MSGEERPAAEDSGLAEFRDAAVRWTWDTRGKLYFGAVGLFVVSAGGSSWQPDESLVTIS
jgi:hypothetical protein